jgi:hypothetical protein
MTFVFHFRVPTLDSGWRGMVHLCTLQITAPTEGDAQARVEGILEHMPEGTRFDLVQV